MSSSPLFFGLYAPPAPAPGRLKARLRTWLPVVAGAMVFAVESTAYFGADRTSAPLQRIVEAIFGYDVCAYWDLIHHLIRKTGHFLGYGMFSLLCFRAFWITFEHLAVRLDRLLRAHGLALAATFLVASADEFHQSFLANRTGQFSDVLLDTSGAAVLSFALFLVMQARGRASRRPEPAGAEVAARVALPSL